MTTLLHLRCSPRGGAAFSSRMAEEVIARLLRHHAGAEIVFRDLSAAPSTVGSMPGSVPRSWDLPVSAACPGDVRGTD